MTELSGVVTNDTIVNLERIFEQDTKDDNQWWYWPVTSLQTLRESYNRTKLSCYELTQSNVWLEFTKISRLNNLYYRANEKMQRLDFLIECKQAAEMNRAERAAREGKTETVAET